MNTTGFDTSIFKVATDDGWHITMLEEVGYTTLDGIQYVIPIGAQSDGASVPDILWNLLPPFGPYWKAAVLHDCAYRNTLEWPDGRICNLTKDQCDTLLYDALQVCCVKESECNIIYEAVKHFGQSSFDNARKSAG